MKYIYLSVIFFLTLTAVLIAGDAAEEVKQQKAQLEEMGISPGDVAVEQGGEYFNKVKGAGGKTCSSCHGNNGIKIKTGFASMPRFYKDAKAVQDLDMRVKFCLEKNMKEKNVKRDDRLVNLSFYVASLANGQPVKTAAVHPAEKQVLKKGKELWYARSGVLDLSCATCHEVHGGKRIRLQTLAKIKEEKVGSRWPAYRFGKEENWTMEDRIRACYSQTRMEPPAYFDETVLSLTQFIMIQSKGAKVAIPGLVR